MASSRVFASAPWPSPQLAPLGGGQVGLKVFLGDLHAIHGIADSRAVERAGRDAKILFVPVHDDQRNRQLHREYQSGWRQRLSCSDAVTSSNYRD